MATLLGNSLDQIGQGYANPPQTGFSATGMSPMWQNILQNPAFASLRQAAGNPQNSNYAGIFPSDAAGPPPNPPATQNFNYPVSPPAFPPATGDNQSGGASAIPSIASAPGSAAGGAPAGGPPSQPYWPSQRQPMMGGGFNAAGFGGLGATGGQRPRAPHWARF